jgi:hypothetical protein
MRAARVAVKLASTSSRGSAAQLIATSSPVRPDAA